jgi:glyoxylase-like metal-dependent hydrolase (beta-lactamase superfamily II)
MKLCGEYVDFYWYPYRMHGFGSNIYAVDHGSEIWLFDCGTDRFKFFDSFLSRLEKDGLEPRKISKVFFTHAHPDHCSGAIKLLKYCSPEFFISQTELSWFDSSDAKNKQRMDGFWQAQSDHAGKYQKSLLPMPFKLLIALTSFQMGSLPTSIKLTAISETRTRIQGPRYTMQMIPTPGHSPGHTSFYFHQEKVLIAGDIFGRIPNKAVLNLPTSNFGDYIRSIEKLKEFSPKYWGTGHGKIIGVGSNKFLELCNNTSETLKQAMNIAEKIIHTMESKGYQEDKETLNRNLIKIIADAINREFEKSPWNAFEQKIIAFSILRELKVV